MRALADHNAKGLIRSEVNFFFIESDRARYEHLGRLVEQWRPKLPAGAKVHLEYGDFEGTVSAILDGTSVGKVLIPSFVMVDPFGVDQTPMSVMSRLLKNPKVEIFVSVMYDFINRFKGEPEFEAPLDSLYGTTQWRDALSIGDSDARRNFLYDLYKSQLCSNGAKQVVHFDLYRRGRPVYAIFHATQHSRGCDKMKEAIWKIAPFGDYSFRSDSHDAASDLFGADLSPLKRLLRQRFGGREVSIDELLEFAATDACPFYTGQVKGVLKDLEQAGDLVVVDGTRKKRGSYPPGTRLTLKPL